MDRQLIERFVADGPLLGKSVAGLSKAELTAFPVPGTWSIQQIVMHMVDSDLIAAHRMKQIIAEENPTLIRFDETAFGQRLFYHDVDLALAADLFAKNRELTAQMLRRQPDEVFAHFGTHNIRGRVTLAEQLELYTNHLHHHLKFLREKRRLLGKPLVE